MGSPRKARRFLQIILVVIITVVAFFIVYKRFQKDFDFHVAVCARFPRMAGYMKLVPVNEKALRSIIEWDEHAVTTFTNAFSDPVQVSVLSNGGHKHLRRVWDANGGYLILTSGRDPIDYEIFISYEGDLPVNLGLSSEGTPGTTITPEFLGNYDIVTIPIPSNRSLEFEYTHSEESR